MEEDKASENKSKFADLLKLVFGKNGYIIYLPRYIATEYPLFHDILVDEPNISEIFFMKENTLTNLQKEALDILISLKYTDRDLVFDLDLLIETLRWAKYFGLNEGEPEVNQLFDKLARSNFTLIIDEIKAMVQEKFITLDRWKKIFGL